MRLIRTRTQYRIAPRGVAAIVILFLLVTVLGFVQGREHSVIIIEGSTTVTDWRTTPIHVTVSTQTTTTVTTITLVTVTNAGGPNISLSGRATTNGLTTTPVSIDFVGVGNASKTYSATVTNGGYSLLIGNFGTYLAKIHFSAPTGPGTCEAGALILFTLDSEMQRDWSC